MASWSSENSLESAIARIQVDHAGSKGEWCSLSALNGRVSHKSREFTLSIEECRVALRDEIGSRHFDVTRCVHEVVPLGHERVGDDIDRFRLRVGGFFLRDRHMWTARRNSARLHAGESRTIVIHYRSANRRSVLRSNVHIAFGANPIFDLIVRHALRVDLRLRLCVMHVSDQIQNLLIAVILGAVCLKSVVLTFTMVCDSAALKEIVLPARGLHYVRARIPGARFVLKETLLRLGLRSRAPRKNDGSDARD